MNRLYFYFNHENKGLALVNALNHSGWRETRDFHEAAICLADSDCTESRKMKLDAIADAGCKIFVYPHAARVNLFYDFPGWRPFSRTTAQLVTAEEHKKVLKTIHYPYTVHTIGWFYCQLRPFRPSFEIQHVLFMPIHANSNGWLSDYDQMINQWAFEKLLKAREKHPFIILVRYLDSLKSCGLEAVDIPGITYFEGRADQSTMQIDQTDLVVSTQTPAYLAVARGVPLLGMGEKFPPRIGWTPETLQFAPNWNLYRDLIRYPLDILSDQDTWLLMQMAAQGNMLTEGWRNRLIGNQFDPNNFVKIIESYLLENISSKVAV